MEAGNGLHLAFFTRLNPVRLTTVDILAAFGYRRLMTFMNWIVPPMGMAPIAHVQVLLPKKERPTLPVIAFGIDRFMRTVPRFFVYAPAYPQGTDCSDFESAMLAIKHSQSWYGPAPSFIVEHATNHVWSFNAEEE